MAFSVTLNGNTYTQNNFSGLNYASEDTGFPAALQDVVEHTKNTLRSNSSTTLNFSTININDVVVVTVAVDKLFQIGQPVTITRDETNYIFGDVTAYNSATGSLSVAIKQKGGTDSASNWTVYVDIGRWGLKIIAATDAVVIDMASIEADAAQTAADRIQTGLDRVQTTADAAQTVADAAQTASDRVQTGLDKVQTVSDAAQTAADRTQTGLDRVQTVADAAQTAADRIQTGLDVTSTDNAKTAAESAQAATELAYDNFDDRYLGPKASDPATDNDTNALIVGALYFNTATGMKVWNGAVWSNAAPVTTTVTVSQISDLTATATEVNYTGGVTSPIQDQLDVLAGATSSLTDQTDVYSSMAPKQDELLVYDTTNGWQSEGKLNVTTYYLHMIL